MDFFLLARKRIYGTRAVSLASCQSTIHNLDLWGPPATSPAPAQPRRDWELKNLIKMEAAFKVRLKKPLGLRIADNQDKIVVLEIKDVGGGNEWNQSHPEATQIQVGDELVAYFQNDIRVSATGKTQDDIVNFVVSHTEEHIELVLKHPSTKADKIDPKTAKDLTYLVELEVPMGLVVGAGNGCVRVLEIDRDGPAARWNASVESNFDFDRQIRINDRLCAYYKGGERIDISGETYQGVLGHLKEFAGQIINLELMHLNRNVSKPIGFYISGLKKVCSLIVHTWWLV